MRDRLIELPIDDAILILKEEHKHRVDGYTTHLSYGGKGDLAEEVSLDALEMAISALEQTKWISVKDRLPKKDGYYLAFVEGYWARCTRLLSFAKDGRKVDEFDFDEGAKNVWYRHDSEYGYVPVEDVTHWMPLPQPPKGE